MSDWPVLTPTQLMQQPTAPDQPMVTGGLDVEIPAVEIDEAPVPTREQILSAMIAAIYEDGDVATVRQGMPSAEWNLLSIAADGVVDLLRGQP